MKKMLNSTRIISVFLAIIIIMLLTLVLPTKAHAGTITEGPGLSNYNYYSHEGMKFYFRAYVTTGATSSDMYKISTSVNRSINKRYGIGATHEWNNKWYWRKVGILHGLVLYYFNADANEYGWISVKRDLYSWEMNDGKNNITTLLSGKEYCYEFWSGGVKITLSFKDPLDSEGWAAGDIQYKIGY